jgi:membrane fusion protein, multidrug efflux system
MWIKLASSICSSSIFARTLMRPKETVYESLQWMVILMALLGGVALAACDRGKQSATPPPLEVATVTIQPQQLVLTTELPGRTSAYLVAEIRPQINGIIQKRLFTEGADVQSGQVLYQIDPAPFQASLDSAKASLAKSRANLPVTRAKAERYAALLTEKAVSVQDYEDRDSALKQAEADVEYCKAAVETARINLGYTQVTTPVSGRIGKSNVTDGALVTAYQATPLATIQQLDPIYVDVPQSTADLLRLKRRMEDKRLHQDGSNQNMVKLILEDGTKYPPEGELQFRDVTVDKTTGSVVLRIVFPNPEGVLLPGMFVRAVVKEGTNEQAILIPQQAVSRDPTGNPIALIVDGEDKVQQRTITVDRAIGDRSLISSGLAAGDRVVVEGLQKIRPGAFVKVTPFGPARKADAQPGNIARTAGKAN